ncbi:ATP synthase epsilon chain [Fructilactobacillus florum 8D]|uniref:ATP synthase epsilon chain n=2 Tax=Fructilactobacillus florum TaxID=640331 RepID=W9EJJ6_9LACO|nr:F0F1 ATP synthase subunit epsilon [Fructilactobacillus florum]EKK20876.1 ATP synthase epsilon chain [Fructilactobacillus florum 2F]ETO39859.1 ATP synthase epsilon chain [Fructilactobacillus florum 8D]KRM92455.1 ATP synthase subunit epsilon [Fructilactobacillus florum DSM 22689 = JCM 16035]
MADKAVLAVSIVTPDGEEYTNQNVELAVVQTKSGDLGIMPNHIPVIAALKIAPAIFKFGDQQSDILAVNGGFIEFSNNELTIVADSAEPKNKIDVNRAANAKERAEHELEKARNLHDTDTMNRAEVALQRALNRINVANRR